MRSWTRRASILAAALALTAVGATTAAASANLTTGAASAPGIECSVELSKGLEAGCSSVVLLNHGQTVHSGGLVIGE